MKREDGRGKGGIDNREKRGKKIENEMEKRKGEIGREKYRESEMMRVK